MVKDSCIRTFTVQATPNTPLSVVNQMWAIFLDFGAEHTPIRSESNVGNKMELFYFINLFFFFMNHVR